MPPRFFVTEQNITAGLAKITGGDAHHLIDVLRKKTGDQIEIVDGKAACFVAEITKIEKETVFCSLKNQKNQARELPVNVTIFQGLPKGKKIELVIQKCTELGVHQIIPVVSERSVPKINAAGEKHKLLRWQEIAKSAAEQAGRLNIPQISTRLKLTEALSLPGFDLKIIPWETEGQTTLKSMLKNASQIKNLAVYIGPEGGFSHYEIELAKSQGVFPVSLGPRILKTETAGIYVLAALSYELEL